MSHDNGNGVSVARLATPSRNRYQFGLLLDVRRLELEQSYFNRKRWMMNRLALGSGVLCGLPVIPRQDSSSVVVGPGVAVDGWGREIIVPTRSPAVDLRQPTDECGAPDGPPLKGAATVTLELCYHECETEPVPVAACDCEGDGDCAASIVRERYRLRVREGVPDRYVSPIDSKECTSLFGDSEEEGPEEPGRGGRRKTLCEALAGQCPDPSAHPCVALATVDLKEDGTLGTIDTSTYRPLVYGNAVLLDLILCLADRVDQCCARAPGPTPTTVTALRAVSGSGQTGTPGQPLPAPLVAEVLRDGTALANELVTFAVTAGGGAVGADAANLAASAVVKSGNDGLATLPMWRLGTAGAQQQVTASIASGTPRLAEFRATARVIEVEPPRVTALWVPNATSLMPGNREEPFVRWLKEFGSGPRIELTFDRKMNEASLREPDSWLRVAQIRAIVEGGGPVRAPTFRLRNLPIKYGGPVSNPMVGEAGVTYAFGFTNYKLATEMGDGDRVTVGGIRFVVLINAEGDNIVDRSNPPVLLDADFAGTGLTRARFKLLWGAGPEEAPVIPVIVNSIPVADTAQPPALPSGDGTPGGQLTAWFEIINK